MVLTQEYIDRFKTSSVTVLSVRGPVPGVDETLDFKVLLANIDAQFSRYSEEKFMNGNFLVTGLKHTLRPSESRLYWKLSKESYKTEVMKNG